MSGRTTALADGCKARERSLRLLWLLFDVEDVKEGRECDGLPCRVRLRRRVALRQAPGIRPAP